MTHIEKHIPNNRDNFFQFGNTAWDRHERHAQPAPDCPKTLKGLSAIKKKQLAKERKEWLTTLHPIMTADMETAHDEIELALESRGNVSPECFGLEGEPYVGKTQIIQRFVDAFHCDNTPGRPFENAEAHGNDIQIVPVVWLPTENTAKQVLQSFLSFYGVKPPKRDNSGLLIDQVVDLVRQHQTQIVVLDDVHNLRGAGVATEFKVIYEKLATVMFLFTRTLADRCAVFDESAGGAQTLERTVWQEVAEHPVASKEWMSLLAAFEGAMPWCHNQGPQLPQHAQLIHDRTGGKAGRLAFLLKRMTLKLIRENTNGEDIITEDLINSIKMTNYETRRAA